MLTMILMFHHPAQLPAAKAECGRWWNARNQRQPNPCPQPPGPPCSSSYICPFLGVILGHIFWAIFEILLNRFPAWASRSPLTWSFSPHSGSSWASSPGRSWWVRSLPAPRPCLPSSRISGRKFSRVLSFTTLL